MLLKERVFCGTNLTSNIDNLKVLAKVNSVVVKFNFDLLADKYNNMGKHKNRRYKLHVSAPSTKSDGSVKQQTMDFSNKPPLEVDSNVFQGIDLLSLIGKAPKDRIDDDTVSVKSYISNKSIKGETIMPKKEKRKLRRQLLLRKVDTVNQLKKEFKEKQKKKVKNETLDMKTLLDSLPITEHPLSAQSTKISLPRQSKTKGKAIEKSKKIQKKAINNVNIYKKILKSPILANDPLGTISQHLKAFVEQERKAESKPTKVLRPNKKNK
ncbi:uncharacterized protein LOC123316097 [Coccinella septempunctata]|uniref:uncharacterized protein LOC123316097 n=1 Tax=Coccinella septempunctata TaxID=41139 RepID=UPI001D08FB6B|nr:uncharacterized protein LOC123316097 [Coccinella septempunctata]